MCRRFIIRPTDIFGTHNALRAFSTPTGTCSWPLVKELAERQSLVRPRDAELHVSQDLGQLVGGLTTRASEHHLVPALAIAPVQVDASHPAAVTPLADAAFAPSAPLRHPKPCPSSCCSSSDSV